MIFSLVEDDTEGLEDGYCYKFKDLFESPINELLTISEVKALVCDRANTEHEGLNLDSNEFRLRERNAERLSRLVADDAVLLRTSIYEKKNFAL